MPSIYRTGTEYTSNTLTLARGSLSDVESVGVYHSTAPNEVPDLIDFTTVQVVTETDPLGSPGTLQIITKVGPRGGDVTLTQGVYQRYVLVVTANEDIIRRVDTLEIL